MIMRFYLFISLFLLFSCGSGDQKICECLEAGDRLNQLSAELLEGEVTPAKKEEMLKLKQEKNRKCKEFESMGGEEMLKRKAECEMDQATEEQNEEMIEIQEQSRKQGH